MDENAPSPSVAPARAANTRSSESPARRTPPACRRIPETATRGDTVPATSRSARRGSSCTRVSAAAASVRNC
eukprot:31395-Pelagococcus_subviridis.AAC.5